MHIRAPGASGKGIREPPGKPFAALFDILAAMGTKWCKFRAAAVALAALAAVYAQAAPGAHRRKPYMGAIAVEAKSGRVLFADCEDTVAYPASCTKLMTLLLVLEDVRAGRYSLSTRATASVRASREKPSNIGILPGQSMTIDDLLMSLMVKSANDAAVVLAEHSASSALAPGAAPYKPGEALAAFVKRMNARAASLKMTSTHYMTPNGYPPPPGSKTPFDTSTAADLAKLGRTLVRMPEVFRYTSTIRAKVTDGAGKPLEFINHNNILVKNKLKILGADGKSEVDGLKTGYIDAGGSSIVLTAKRGATRAIVVVLGSDGSSVRDENARRLMMDALGGVATW